MNKYFIYMLSAVKCELYYKVNIVGMVLTSMFTLLIQVKLWQAIYSDNTTLSGITYSGVFVYLVVGMIFRKFIGNGIDDAISDDFESGKIATDLLRPQNYFMKSLCFDLGRGVVHLVVFGCISLIYLIWNRELVASYTPRLILCVAISAMIAYVIYVLISFCIGITSVWFGRSIGLSMIKAGLFALLGGTFIPVDFYPVWLQGIVNVLPFKYIYYVPMSFLIDVSNERTFWLNVIIQILWCAFFAIVGKVLYRAAKKRMVIQGG